ncbi:MAG: hypothetical protein MJZ59_05840, partial [Paludibacteraceae bacterium]|nr:hypothetical protein [Paludibacteraceae bacterium]
KLIFGLLVLGSCMYAKDARAWAYTTQKAAQRYCFFLNCARKNATFLPKVAFFNANVDVDED